MKKYNKYIKFAVALLFFFFGSLLRYIPIYIFDLDINNISSKTSILLSSFSTFITFLILFIMYYKDILQGFKDLKKDKFKPLEKGFTYWFYGLMVMVITNYILTLLNNGGTSNNDESIRTMINTLPWVSSIFVAVLSPTIEELVFRKAFLDIFQSKWMFLLTSTLVFSGLHIVLSPIYSYIDILYLIPYSSVGFALAYAYFESKNIAVPITMHILHNTLTLVSMLILGGVIL